ncbi:MAG: single-stranded DNA-binding protein [Cyclobacteriaceae bacterium]
MKNTVSLIGRIGKEVKTNSHKDKKVTNFSLATSETYKDRETGEKKEVTEWHKIVMWGNENVIPYLTSGTLISVEGKIKYGSYDKDVKGEKVAIPTTEIEIEPDKLILLSPKKEG